jgi:translation initiation factor 6
MCGVAELDELSTLL